MAPSSLRRRWVSAGAAILMASLACTIDAQAQNPCADAIEVATRAYEEGRLGDVISTLTPCHEMTRERRWEAYRLLALAHLFEERREEAERAVHEMLELNPRYETSAMRDPIELVRVIESYTIFPRIAVGVRGGLGVTGRRIDAPRAISPVDDYAGTRRFTLGSDIGVGMFFAVTPQIGVEVDALSSNRAFSTNISRPAGSATEYSERLSYATLPAMLRYSRDLGGVTAHVAAGYYYQILLDATSDITMRPGDTAASFTDQGVLSTKDRRRSSGHGVVLGAGLSLPLGDGSLLLDGRYELGLSDIVKPEERYNDAELQYRYLYVDNGFRLRNFFLSLGYAHPISYAATR